MANISHLYYYLVYFVTFLERLRNISLMNLVKQPINRTCLCRILQFPSMHGGHIWYYRKAQHVHSLNLLDEFPNYVNFRQ